MTADKLPPCPAVWDCYSDGAMRCCREQGHDGWHRPSPAVWNGIKEILAAPAVDLRAEVERLTSMVLSSKPPYFAEYEREKARAEKLAAALREIAVAVESKANVNVRLFRIKSALKAAAAIAEIEK